jgi:hypothetical protein
VRFVLPNEFEAYEKVVYAKGILLVSDDTFLTPCGADLCKLRERRCD